MLGQYRNKFNRRKSRLSKTDQAEDIALLNDMINRMSENNMKNM